MRKFLLLFLPLTLNAQVFEADTVQPRILTIDQDSLHFDISFQPEDGLIHGTVKIWCRPVQGADSIWLDAKANIDVITDPYFNGDTADWRRDQGGVVLFPAEGWQEGMIEISFRSRPAKGVYFNGWEDPTERARRQIFTQGQGIDHRHWLPHQDAQNDKLKTSMTIFFEEGYEVLGNGRLIEKREADNGIYWTYAMDHPHSSYLIAFTVGEYEQIEMGTQPYRAVYMYTDHMDDVPTTYYANEQIWNYLNERIDYPYVWSTYRQVPVANFPHGAMENTCLTIFSENFITNEAQFDDLNYVYVNAHELAHHWFGDLITVPSSHDFWLHEGFATYYQMEAEREVFGEKHYTEKWFEALRLSREANVNNQFPLQHSQAGSSRFYQLGALVLRALETEIGTEVFDRAVASYLEQYAFGLVTTVDFKEVVETTCDCDLDDFFEGYVENPFQANGYLEVREEGRKSIIRVRVENQLGDPLPMENLRMRIVFKRQGSEESRRIELDGSEWVEFEYENVKMVEIDPDHRYPISWSLDLEDDLIYQSVEEGSYATRLRVSGDYFETDGASVSHLKRMLDTDIASSSSNAWIDSLALNCPEQLQSSFFQLWLDENRLPPSAQTIAENWNIMTLEEDQVERIFEILEQPFNSSRVTDEGVFWYSLWLIQTKSPRVSDIIEILEHRSGGMDRNVELFRSYLITAVNGASHPDGVAHLLDLSGPSYSDEVRISAWQFLSMVNYDRKDLRQIIYGALTSQHRHLRNAARGYARKYLDTMNREREIAEIEFVLREAHPDDIERVERILDIELEIEQPRLER